MIKGIRPSLAQAGAIKIGRLSDEERKSKSGTTWRAPVKLDHFLVTRTTRGADGNLEVDEEMMTELSRHGYDDPDGKIRTIPIILHSDEIDDVFPTVYAWYAGKQVVCRGDGEKATRWEVKDKQKTGRTKELTCPCPFLERDERGVQKCKPHGVLHCTIALPGRAVAGAVYRFRTTGIISVEQVIGSLKQIIGAIGTLSNVPLVMRVTPIQVNPDGKSRTVYSVHLELREQVLEAQQAAIAARNARAQLGAPKVQIRALLQPPAGDQESPEEQAEVDAEFYPQEDVDHPEEPKNRTKSVKDAAASTAKNKKPQEKPKPKEATPEETKDALEEAKRAQGMKTCPSCKADCPASALLCHSCGGSMSKSKPKQKPKPKPKPKPEPEPEEQKPKEEPPPPSDDDAPDYGSPDEG